MSRTIGARTLLEGWCENVPPVPVTGLADHPQAVGPGNAYLAVSGTGVDEARARGAALVIHDSQVRMPACDVPFVPVPGLRGRLSALAARFHCHPSQQLTLAGVSGGACSTAAHFLAQSWQRDSGDGGIIGSAGHGPFGHLQATSASGPLALQAMLSFCLDEGAEKVALEMPLSSLRRGYCDDIAFDVAVFNSPGTAGETVGEINDPRVLSRLFDECRPRFAVVDHDCPAGKELTRHIGQGTQVLTCGVSGSAEVRGAILQMDSAGMVLSIASPWGGGTLRTSLMGAFNVPALLTTAGVLALLGMPWPRVVHQLELMRALPGRLHGLEPVGGQPVVVVDDGRTPAALSQALQALRAHLHGRLICVIAGDGNRPGLHSRMLARAARSRADEVLVSAGGKNVAEGLNAAIRRAVCKGREGDIVLVAGAGGDMGCSAPGRAAASGAEAMVLAALEEAA